MIFVIALVFNSVCL